MQIIGLDWAYTAYMPPESRPNRCEDSRGIVALDGHAIPQAICIFDNWSFNSSMIHIWIGNPMVLRRGFQQAVFSYAFSDGRNKIIGTTPADNLKALKFIRHMGFHNIGRIIDGYKVGVDFILTEMNKSQCRFINGKERQSSPTRLPRRGHRSRRSQSSRRAARRSIK